MKLERYQSTITLEAALELLLNVRKAANVVSRNLAMVVVDIGGRVVVAQNMDGSQISAMRLAEDKAFTAVACGAPTEAWSDCSKPDGSDWGLALSAGGKFIVFPGGLPIKINGVLLGGLGVSGGPAEIDRSCGASALIATGFDSV